MVGVYIFVAIFSHFSPHAVLSYIYPAPTYAVLSVSFPKVDGLKIGTPVVLDGARVGSVTEIQPQDSQADSGDSSFMVALRLDSRIKAELPQGTVGLITHLVHKTSTSSAAVVELVSPDEEGDASAQATALKVQTLPGFSSLSDFWSHH